MKLSLEWLRELVDLPDDVERLCDDLTMLGIEVEAVEPFRLDYPKVVIGKVLDAQPHPDADRLRVCRVSDGQDELDIVCGAPNVRTGLTVAVATVGAVLPGGLKIKKSKIRGQVSQGMICSERELELGDGHDGIMELPEDFAVGEAFARYFGHEDTSIEVEITPNRPDMLSHLGVARELAARYRASVRWPELGEPLKLGSEADGWSVDIQDPAGCRRFSGQLFRGITVGPAPRAMQNRLRAVGQRPINAVVDVSNYVLFEWGHPNHAFDLDKLHGQQIVVRSARDKEVLNTLDGQQRELQSDHLVVADEQQAQALAGIMGGADSEVGDATRNLLLEVAVFDPQRVRRGRRSVGLNTEASYRFERGVDFQDTESVQRRLVHLLKETVGGEASGLAFDASGQPRPEPARVFTRASQVRRVVGVDVSPKDMAEIMTRLDVETEMAEERGEAGIRTTQPSFRHDLLEEIDVIEEIARHHGYEHVPVDPNPPMLATALRSTRERVRAALRGQLPPRGYFEVLTSSFMAEEDPDLLRLAHADERRRTVEVMNPLVSGQAQLRTTSLPEMLRIVDRNRRRGFSGPVRLFQLDRCFVAVPGETLPAEPERLVLLWSGPSLPAHRTRPAEDVDLATAVGEIVGLMAALGVTVESELDQGEPYHAEGRSVKLRHGDVLLGSCGELDALVTRGFDLEERGIVAEIDIEALEAALPQAPVFQALSPYPPVRRDLSLVVPTSVPYAAVARTLREVLGEVLEESDVFDLYEGEGLPPQTRAVGVRMTLRSASGTLKDKRVEALMAKLLDGLQQSHAIQLRT